MIKNFLTSLSSLLLSFFSFGQLFDAPENFGTVQEEPLSICHGDFDGDGNLDVALPSEFGHSIFWFPNNGSGEYTERIQIEGEVPYIVDITAGDIDNNGTIDLVTCSAHSPISFFNDGAGNFQKSTGLTTDQSLVRSTLSDMNGDGYLDLACTSWAHGFVWFENDQSGNFLEEHLLPIEFSNYDHTIHCCDMDSDGDNDILSSDQYGNENHQSPIFWVENLGNEEFNDLQIISTEFNSPHNVYAADLDNDNDLDIISSFESSTGLAWFENTGSLEEFIPHQIMTDMDTEEDYVISTAGDFDLDSDIDIVMSKRHDFSDLRIYRNNGVGHFCSGEPIGEADYTVYAMTSGDYDNDGDLDVFYCGVSDVNEEFPLEGLGTVSQMENLTICNVTSITEKEGQKEAVVFPNPATRSSGIYVNLPKKTSSMILTDNSGKQLERFNLTEVQKMLFIDTSELKPGQYLLQFEIANGTMLSSKFIME